MANAKIEKVEVPQPPVMEERVLLELTPDEAVIVRDILGRVGGRVDGRRRLALDLYYTLDKVLPRRVGVSSAADMDGIINFK